MPEKREFLDAASWEAERFFDLSLDLMLMCTAGGEILRANAAFAATLGYPAGEVVGRSILAYVHPADADRTHAVLRELAEGERVYGFENRFRHRQGGYRTFNWTAVLAEGTVYATARDVTDQHALGAILRVTQRRYEDLFRAVRDTIIIADPGRGITEANPALTTMFGYTLEEVRGRTTEILHEDAAAYRAMGVKLEANLGGAPFVVESNYRRKNGEVFPARTTAYSFKDAEGRVSHLVGIIEDLTERRRLEATLHEQVEALEQANRLKDQFLSILSHELRTPINAIMGFTSILDDELVGPLTETQRAYTGRVLQASDSLLSLVSDLIDLSRVQAGAFAIRPAPTDVARVIERTLALHEEAAAAKGIAIRPALAPDLPPVEADAERIGQLVSNLVGNAVKFTQEGGRVEVRACASGDGVRVEVADDGPGIDPAQVEALFQPFTQVDMSYTRRYGGLGLGLAIARSIVEAHGGRMGVDTRVGEGATFWFTLPRRGA